VGLHPEIRGALSALMQLQVDGNVAEIIPQLEFRDAVLRAV
jgi:hypothetical protein